MFRKATLYATATGSAGKGLNAGGELTIESGKLIVTTTGKQAVQNKETSSPKGMKATGNLTIRDGFVRVEATGGEGSEGIESKAVLTIHDGTIIANCADDCLNATKAIEIHGGNTYCYSSTNDGIDSNGTLTVTGGLVIAAGSTQPEAGFDCDQNTFKITGGTLIGVGGSTSTPTASASTQRSFLYGGSSFSKGDYVVVYDEDEKALVTFEIPRAYSKMTLLYSSAGMAKDKTYYLAKATVSGGSSWGGYYLNGTFSATSLLTPFTTSSMVTTVGSTGGPGGR